MLTRSAYKSLPVRAARLCSVSRPGVSARPFTTLIEASRPSCQRPASSQPALRLQQTALRSKQPALRSQWQLQCPLSARSVSTSPAPPPHDPLHILFCGTDDFSCVALQALYDEMVASPCQQSIASIHVLVRPAKPTGRGLHAVVASPVQQLAVRLGLPVHERDSCTGWTPPHVYNLIVAVSFGLFVPPRILRACQYGGLNVHPSLLPDLHGAAPIEHAILRGRERTGVTVQTLHETTFDGGRRLRAAGGSSSDDVGEDDIFRVDDHTTARALRARLAPVGARLLVEVIQQGLFLPGAVAEGQEHEKQQKQKPAPAPKLTKADREIQFTTAAHIDRQARALGPVWTHVVGRKKGKPVTKRVILEDVGLAAWPWPLPLGDTDPDPDQAAEMDAVTFRHNDRDVVLPVRVDGTDIILPIGVKAAAAAAAAAAAGTDLDRAALRIRQAKVEGYATATAAQALGRHVTKTLADLISWDVVKGKTEN